MSRRNSRYCNAKRNACRKWVDPQDFIDLRKQAGLKRAEAAEALNVTARTIQNWETGGARIPWMAYRMLRILRGFALPSVHWHDWTIHGDRLYAPNGRWYDANSLQQIEQVFAMARLWRQEYTRRHKKALAVVVPFPDAQKPFTKLTGRIGGLDGN